MLATRLTAWLRPALTVAATAAMLALTACGGGSGAPNNPYEPLPPTPGPLVVVPAEAVAYAGTPLILSISGGTPPYQAFSANPAVLPVPTNVTGNTLTLLAANVDTAQSANVTIRDAAGALSGAEITVRPSLLLPASITIVGNGAPCDGGDVCSGQTGSATVRVTGSGGVPLAGRQVRFDVVQGQYALQTTNPGSPLASTQTVVSDANGEARVIIAVPATTPTQIALLRATELTTGSQVTGQFVIAQVTSGEGVLSVAPGGTTTITGPQAGICSAGVRVSYYVFGGTPPYRIVTNYPDAATLVGSPVPVNGGGFDVITNGSCFTGLTFAVTDATGRTLTTGLPIVDNVPGTATPTSAHGESPGVRFGHGLGLGTGELRGRIVPDHGHRQAAVQRDILAPRRDPEPEPGHDDPRTAQRLERAGRRRDDDHDRRRELAAAARHGDDLLPVAGRFAAAKTAPAGAVVVSVGRSGRRISRAPPRAPRRKPRRAPRRGRGPRAARNGSRRPRPSCRGT